MNRFSVTFDPPERIYRCFEIYREILQENSTFDLRQALLRATNVEINFVPLSFKKKALTDENNERRCFMKEKGEQRGDSLEAFIGEIFRASKILVAPK